jgi:MFS transporter, NNP family, nitrate/nitrite transporter
MTINEKHQRAVQNGPLSFGAGFPALLLMTGIFYVNFMARISLAPLLPSIEQDLGFTHGESGALFLLVSGGYCLAIIFSGHVSSRINHRGAIILSALLLGLCMIGITFTHSLSALRGAVFLAGLAAGFYLPSGIAVITSLIRPGDWGKAMAVHELAPNLSFITAPIVCELLLARLPWRGIMGILGLASICIGAVFVFLGKGGDHPGQAPSVTASRRLFAVPSFWIMVALFSMGITGSLGIFSMLPLYLVAERGLERNWANTLIALSRFSGLFMAFISGWVSDRLGPRVTLIGVMGLSGLATAFLALAPDRLLAVMLFVQPMAAGAFFAPALAALPRVGPADTRNILVSFTVPAAFLVGGGVAPIAIGAIGDAWSFSLGIGLFGVLILSTMLPAARLKMSD